MNIATILLKHPEIYWPFLQKRPATQVRVAKETRTSCFSCRIISLHIHILYIYIRNTMIIKENNNKKQELSSCKNASNFNSSVFFRSPRCFRDIVLVKLMMSLRFHLNAGWVGSNLVGSNSDGVDVYQYIYIYTYTRGYPK